VPKAFVFDRIKQQQQTKTIYTFYIPKGRVTRDSVLLGKITTRQQSLIQTDTNKTQNQYFGLNTRRTHIPGLSHIKYHHFVATKHYILTKV